MLPLISAVSEILSILKNPIRLKMLFFLSLGGKTYSELMHEVACDSGKFSFHLRSMKDFFVIEDGVYSLSPLGERLYRFIEGMEDVLMVVYVQPTLEIFVKEDGSALAEVRAEYNSPTRSILAEVFSYAKPARAFIELFVEKKASQIFGCKTHLTIRDIKFEEGRLKAEARLEIERYAQKNGTWRIRYTPSSIISEIQNVPWDVEGNVALIIHLPPGSRVVGGMEDGEVSGEGYSICLRYLLERGTIHITLQLSKKKGVVIPQSVLDTLLLNLEYEVKP